MDAFDCTMNPFRRPRWRAERAMQMVEHRPSPLKPRSSDDRYVREYRWFLLQYLAEDADEDQRNAAIQEQPHVYHAHSLRYHPDTELRQILEARLLTSESFAQIAERFGVEPAAIDYYEKLFFHVRDRLECSDWIVKVIRELPEERAPNPEGILTTAQRGLVYRLFAYHGGSEVLDAVIAGLAPSKIALCGGNLGDWFDDAFVQLVRSSAVAAVAVHEVDQTNTLRAYPITS